MISFQKEAAIGTNKKDYVYYLKKEMRSFTKDQSSSRTLIFFTLIIGFYFIIGFIEHVKILRLLPSLVYFISVF